MGELIMFESSFKKMLEGDFTFLNTKLKLGLLSDNKDIHKDIPNPILSGSLGNKIGALEKSFDLNPLSIIDGDNVLVEVDSINLEAEVTNPINVAWGVIYSTSKISWPCIAFFSLGETLNLRNTSLNIWWDNPVRGILFSF